MAWTQYASSFSSGSHPRRLTGKVSHVVLKDGNINLEIPLEDILFVRAEHVYVRIFLRNDQSLLYRYSLSGFEELVRGGGFLRIHRGYLINRRAVTGLTGNSVLIGDHKLPISRARRAAVRKVLNG